MATVSLKISLDSGRVVKTMQFDPSTTVYDACRIIREKILEANQGDPKEYGLFLTSDEDTKKGIWLEPSRSLDYYILRNGDLLEYNKKMRNLRVRMLDGTVKTLLVDDSQIVANLMVVICTKIGITNYDEYGLVREDLKDECDPCDKPNFGTLTLKRKHQEKERDTKMDQLRKKLRTDDEVNWVEPSKTLREQGVDITETLLLRRKLFFSDRNVDSRDPVQLNLLYVQARDAIVDGTHPVTQDKACEFAGIQCQIQFGDHKEEKHTTGFLDLKEFLPSSYVKVKGIEKKVFKEHRKHVGLSELDAKVLYTKSARSLRTYGVAFFLVKEKMKGKNKLVPRLLGVTKDSVLRLDEKTKETLQTWPLTTVKRWCASPNTFTLDFGDYSDQYYSVQTTEAEQILQVIAGYIDIILKRQRAKDHLGVDGDEGSAMLEDTVAPHKANIIQHDTFKSGKVNTESVAKPAVLRPGAEGAKPYAMTHMTSMQQTTISGQIITGHAPPATVHGQQQRITSVISEPQKALLSTISSGRELIRQTEQELVRASIPELGVDSASMKWRETTLDSNRQRVHSHIAAMNAATAQVVTLTSGTTDEVDHTAVGAAITTITSNLPEMTKGVQMLAALMEDNDNGDRLLDATRKLCDAFSDLLTAAEPETKEPRQSLLNAASRVGEASTSVLHTITDENQQDTETQDILLSLAKAVANTTAALVLKAKHVAAQCKDDQVLQNNIISAATQCALATSQLVACAKVVAPTIHNAQCREQLSSASSQVVRSVERLMFVCEGPLQHEDLTSAARKVTDALERMLAACDSGERRTTITQTTVESVLTASEAIACADDAGELVRQARALGHATARLVADIKCEAESQPSGSARRLLAAAKLLADATARMVEAARLCATNPQDRDKQESLRKAAEELRFITVDYAQGQDIVHSQIQRLQETARQATSSATQLIASTQNANNFNTNQYTQESVIESCQELNESSALVNEAVREANLRPQSAFAHLDLIDASEDFLQSSGHTISSCRSLVATVAEPSAVKMLNDSSQRLTSNCAELRSAVSRARISLKGSELEAAKDHLHQLDQHLIQTLDEANSYDLRPLPGETSEWAMQQLVSSTRQISSHISENLEPESTPALAREIKKFVQGVRAAAAQADDGMVRERIISNGREVVHYSMVLIETIQKFQSTTETIDIEKLRNVTENIHQSMERTMQSVPSHQELDSAVQTVNETLHILDIGEFPSTNKTYGELQSELNSAAVEVSKASSGLVGSVHSTTQLSSAGRGFGDAFNSLMGVAVEIAGLTEERETQSQMVTTMKSVTINSSKLLTTAKAANQDQSRPNMKHELTEAARAVTDSVNRLVDVCSMASPGLKQCDSAVRSLQALMPLSLPDLPTSDGGYFATMDAILEKSKALSSGMSGMAKSARARTASLGEHVQNVGEALCGILNETAHVAYIISAADPTSVAGRAAVVERSRLMRAASAISHACAVLRNRPQQRDQVLSSATEIAKHTSALCNLCRVASAKCSEPKDKRHFVQAAKEVANATAQLVKDIKMLDNDYSEEHRARCAEGTLPLEAAVKSLVLFADKPHFAGVPAKLSASAKRNQEDILECGRSIIEVSCAMINAAREVSQHQEKEHWQNLASHSKTLSDQIKTLVTHIREKAPGQRECIAGEATLSKLLRDIDQAAMEANSAQLHPNKSNSLQGFASQVECSVNEISDRLESVRTAAKGEPENLAHAVVHTISFAESLCSSGIGVASLLSSSSNQSSLLDCTRTVLEALQHLLRQSHDVHANYRSTTGHSHIDEAYAMSRTALAELQVQCLEVAAGEGAVGPAVEAVTRAVLRLQDNRMSLIGSLDEAESFVDYQTRMVGAAKEIARLSTEMTAKAATDSSRLVPLGNELSSCFASLANDSHGACSTTPMQDVAHRIRSAVLELGESVTELIKSGGQCGLSATHDNQRTVANNAKVVNEKVVSVLSALQAGSRGTQACIAAASTIAASIGDLDTTILFATAGTLHSDRPDDSFSLHRESILQTAKTLVEETKGLVAAAAGTQEQLANAARTSLNTIVQLCEVVKQGAMSLGCTNPESQVLLLNAARDVAQALKDLTIATKGASGKHVSHPDMETLKQTAKVMVTNVTSLLKTVKAVEDEHTRGIRALESTIEAITQEMAALNTPTVPAPSSPEELIRHTRLMTVATASAVAAGTAMKQQQLTAAANLGRKTVIDLMQSCKGAAFACESIELRNSTISAGLETGSAFRSLMQAVLAAAAGDTAVVASLPERSRRVAVATAQLVALADQLKGSEWVDPSDPCVIAETELLGAAASIDAAAKKLDALRPRKTVKVQEADESLNFDEMILEAAKSIIAATSALIRAASAAQRELIDLGKVAPRPASSSLDGQWSEGLVSAARLVCAAAHSLVEAANALVQGAGSEERLISSARQVATSTAQLLVACKVKADPNSESTRRLQSAGASVIRSTDNLVRAAREAIINEDERSLVLNRRMVGGIAQEIDARSEVLRIEKELDEARGRLNAIRQAKYRLKGDASGGETDSDICLNEGDTTQQYRVRTPNSSFVNTTYSPNSTYTQHHTQNTTNMSSINQSSFNQLNQSSYNTPTSPGYQNGGINTSYNQSALNQSGTSHNTLNQSGFNQSSLNQSGLSQSKTAQSPTFSSFRPQDEPKQNYEGFTTRTDSVVIVDAMTKLRTDDAETVFYKRVKPAPPPRRASMLKYEDYETRLFDTPRPTDINIKEEKYESSKFTKEQQQYNYTSPISPKFNARELKGDFKKFEPVYSTNTLPKSPYDGTGHFFTDHQKVTENIPGGTKQSEYTIKSESYASSTPKTEFVTSTPTKFDEKFHQQEFKSIPNPDGQYVEESTTEVKEIPNGTQKITTTKIYSSSPVNITSTKFQPIQLEGIDELSKFDETKESSGMSKEMESLDKKFSKQTIKSETIERKSVMTSSRKSETSSTVTKKFGNF